MRKILVIIIIALLLICSWYGVWWLMMRDDVKALANSFDHQGLGIRAATPSAALKADGVYASGFPFAFRVTLHRPTLTQIWQGESYAISTEKIEIARDNDRYRLYAPETFDAMYAVQGKAPERFTIKLNEVPAILLRNKQEGGAFREFAAQLPRKLVLNVELSGQVKQIGFDFMPLNVPIFLPVPADVSRPLQIFIGMLREAFAIQHA